MGQKQRKELYYKNKSRDMSSDDEHLKIEAELANALQELNQIAAPFIDVLSQVPKEEIIENVIGVLQNLDGKYGVRKVTTYETLRKPKGIDLLKEVFIGFHTQPDVSVHVARNDEEILLFVGQVVELAELPITDPDEDNVHEYLSSIQKKLKQHRILLLLVNQLDEPHIQTSFLNKLEQLKQGVSQIDPDIQQALQNFVSK